MDMGRVRPMMSTTNLGRRRTDCRRSWWGSAVSVWLWGHTFVGLGCDVARQPTALTVTAIAP